jgi:DNA-binding NarL/FixJ family response regulator
MEDDSTALPGQRGKIGILVIDDHRIFREGLRNILYFHDDLEILGEGANGRQALELVNKLQPDIVLMDINIPLINGIQVTRQLMAERARSRVIMLTAYDDEEQQLHAMRAGAAAYCPKDVEPDKLVETIREVVRGRYVVGGKVYDKMGIEAWINEGIFELGGPYYADAEQSFSPLSSREMEILHCVTRGMSNKEIARALNISHQTVKNHMTSILKKLAVEDRTQAAVFALRRGWVRLSDTDS